MGHPVYKHIIVFLPYLHPIEQDVFNFHIRRIPAPPSLFFSKKVDDGSDPLYAKVIGEDFLRFLCVLQGFTHNYPLLQYLEPEIDTRLAIKVFGRYLYL